jgi:Spy/CpxP family protein refolding chaperone
MTTKHSRKILCGLVIGAVLLASAAIAQPDPNAPCPKGDRPGPGAWMQEKLGLTDEQAAQWQQLRTSQQEKMKAAQEAIQEKRKALGEAAQSGAGEAAIRAAAAELGTALGDAAVLRAAHTAEIKNILTAEQLEKWQQLKAERKERRGQMGGPGAWGRGEGKGFRTAGQPGCPMAAEGRPGLQMNAQGLRGPRGPQGQWGPQGPRGRMGPPDPEKIIEMKDTNGDGKLSLEEFTATKMPSPAEIFEKADTNGDGFLTADELKESMAQFKGPKVEPQ